MSKWFTIASLLIIMIPFSARALEFYPEWGPLETRTQNPLYLLFLNQEPESPHALEKGHFEFKISSTVSNFLERANPPGGIGLDLDMELYRTVLSFSYGFYSNFEVKLEVPFLSFNGGFLDAFIQDYHNVFGFPNGGRNRVPNGRFNYQVTQGGRVLYSPGPSTFGLSDLEISLKNQILSEKGRRPALAFRATFKIPTGDRGRGLGSGAPDVHFNLSLAKSYKRFHAYTNVGYLVLGGFGPLDHYLNPVAVTFSQAFEIDMTHIASVVAQIQGNSPLFHGTGTSRFDGVPLDLNVGFKGSGPRSGRWRHFRWDLAFTEDLIPSGPSVDFSVQAGLGAQW